MSDNHVPVTVGNEGLGVSINLILLEVIAIGTISECILFYPLSSILTTLGFNSCNNRFDSKVHLEPLSVVLFVWNPGSVAAALWMEM